ncbi:hypothetical protein [Metabacillus sp. Hm71]|uniref:hypothetical protein n=1 Tax=Metabacillus sp. Hm71 TaxID=3450743 RepID=UPI003F4351EA
MQKMKLLVAGCLFSCMFGSGWFLNEKIKREYVDSIIEGESTIQLINTEAEVEFLLQEEKVFEKFKPREYVRIVNR